DSVNSDDGIGHGASLFSLFSDDTVTDGDDGDTLIGGPGDDELFGGQGDDTFLWHDGDQGTSDSPATDTIMDLVLGGDDPHGDGTIDLSDLLAGRSDDPITDYLLVENGGDDTIVKVNTSGGVDTDNFDQQIVIKGVGVADLVDGYDTSDQGALIQALIDNGKLNVDGS